MPPEEVKQRLDERRGDTKKCTNCGEEKPRTEFHKSHDGKHGPVLKSICKICHAAQVREWYSRNTERAITNHRRLRIKQAYGLTPEQYDAMVEEQNGVCAICGRPERAKRDGKVMRMPVDHCHKTGRVRALLCHACNRAIGLLGEDIDLMRKAIEYLLSHRAAAEEGGQ
ncbi:endonuclease VII domain-containing protein [Streptomyces mirabilis]